MVCSFHHFPVLTSRGRRCHWDFPGDPGGLPIYKDGMAVGGVGIEGDGVYTVDRDPSDFDQPFEEVIAASAVRGFEAPALIRADNILVDGIRLPYTNATNPPAPPTIAFRQSSRYLSSCFFPTARRATSAFCARSYVGGISGEVDTRFFPFSVARPSGPTPLTAAEVQTSSRMRPSRRTLLAPHSYHRRRTMRSV